MALHTEYRCQDTTGTTWTASTGANGTLVGGDTFATAGKSVAGPGGLYPLAIQLNGIDDYLQTGLGSTSFAASAYSICMRYKHVSGNDAIFSVPLTTTSRLVIQVSGGLYTLFVSGGTPSTRSGGAPSGNWEHLAVVVDRPNLAIHFYVNGSLVGSMTGQPSTSAGTTNWYAGAAFSGAVRTLWCDGSFAGVNVYDHALTLAEVEADMALGVPEPLADGVWGQFTLHSTKGTTAEITALAGEDPYFPRHLDLAACRAAGLTLHSSLDDYDNMVAVTTDHSSGTGRGAGGLFDDIEDSWSWLTTALYTGADQREACQPVLDAANGRILYFAHDDTSNFQTYNQQHAVVMSSTDGVTLSTLDDDICPFVSNHTGYGQFLNNFNNSGQWTAVHHIASGEDYWLASSTATDPTEFALGEHFFTQLSHIVGTDKCISSGAWLANFGGKTWYIGLIEARDAVDLNSISLVAIEVAFTPGRAPRPKGGYYTLYSDSVDTGNATYNLTGDFSLVTQNGNLYLIGTGEEQDTTQHVVLLKMSTTDAAPYTAPIAPVTSSGRLVVPNKRTNVFLWNAANDAVPSDITIAAASGTNASSQTLGTGYTLLTGSGSTQSLSLTIGNHDLDPSDFEMVDFTIWGMKLNDKQSNQQHGIKFGQNNNAATIYFNTDSNVAYAGGRLRVYDTNSAVFSDDAHILPFNAGSADTANYARTRGFHMTFRLMDQGEKLLVLLTDPNRSPYNDAQCVFYLDLTSYTIPWEDCFAQIVLSSTTPTFAAASMSFSKLTIDTYATVPSASSPGSLPGTGDIGFNPGDAPAINFSALELV